MDYHGVGEAKANIFFERMTGMASAVVVEMILAVYLMSGVGGDADDARDVDGRYNGILRVVEEEEEEEGRLAWVGMDIGQFDNKGLVHHEAPRGLTVGGRTWPR